MTTLQDRVVLVTGASRGVGRGVAIGLANAGARVYATGRRIAETDLGPGVVAIPCDHTEDAAVEAVFQRIDRDAGALDILVNSAWGGYERMVEDGKFTWGVRFWDQPRWRWDAMINAGVRAAFVASQFAATRMVEKQRGLIVHISHWAAQKHIGNTLYGIAKSATDKMTHDMDHELRPHNVVVVSLYPGLVRTEAVLAAGIFDLSNSESPEFLGRAVAALAHDPNAARWSGQVVVSAALAQEYGFTDVDGKQPRALTIADV